MVVLGALDSSPTEAAIPLRSSILTVLDCTYPCHDTPSGFYWGADGALPVANGSSVPYTNHDIGGSFGAYDAEVYTWLDWQGCASGRIYSSTDVSDANANQAGGYGVGTSLFWYMAGPGDDPNYTYSGGPSGTPTSAQLTEAGNWGKEQAQKAIAVYTADGPTVGESPLLVMDIEQGTGFYNGWTEATQPSSCGNTLSTTLTAPDDELTRYTFNGFWNAVSGAFKPAVYSSPDYWQAAFGGGTCGSLPNCGTIPHTYQLTAETSYGTFTPTNPPINGWNPPTGAATGAQFFGGVDSSYELEWQWTQASCDQGNSCDYDQIDTNDWP